MSPRKRYAPLQDRLIVGPQTTAAPPAIRTRRQRLATLRRDAGNSTLRRLAALAPHGLAGDASTLVRRSSDEDDPEAEDAETYGADADLPDVSDVANGLQPGQAEEVLEMLDNLNDGLGLGLDIADMVGAAFLEDTVITAAVGVAALLGEAVFIVQAIGSWISAWGESDRRVAILGSCAGIVAAARGEQPPPAPQSRWLALPGDRERWNDVWSRNTVTGRDWVRDSLTLLGYTRQRLRARGDMGQMLLPAAQHLTSEFQADYNRNLPRVVALLLKAREDPARALNALYQPLAREHLQPGSDRERYSWPP